MTGSEIISYLAEHASEVAILDPAIRVAAGVAREQVIEFVGPQRIDNLKRVAAEALKKLHARRVTPEKPSLSVSIPLLEAARDESRDELVDIWASLLAMAADPARRGRYRKEYVDIAKQLEPLDALVLPELETSTPMNPSRVIFIMNKLQVQQRQVILSFRALARLELVDPSRGDVYSDPGFPKCSPLGYEFLVAIRGQ